MNPQQVLQAAWRLAGDVRPLGSGLINDTYLAHIRHQLPAADADALTLRGRAPSSRFDVPSSTPASSSGPRDQAGRRLDALTTKVGDGCRLVLQRVNGSVFRDAELLMENVARVSAHLSGKQRTWAPELIRTAAGRSFARADGEVWRLWTYLPGAGALAAVENDRQAEVAGSGFGRTYRWLQDLGGPRLRDSIPGFLQLHHYLHEFDGCRGAPADLAAAVDARRALADRFRQRTGYIHGDCRIEHLVLDEAGNPSGVLDLDTVMWGNWAWEFGDLVRSMSGDHPHPSRFEAAARGYVGEAGVATTAEDLVLAPRYTTFMLGVRFLSDHLLGDIYFKTGRRGENLERARAQFRLVETLESMEPEMRARARSLLEEGRRT